jgi:hypothetical protein
VADKLEPKGMGAGGGFNGATSWSTALPGRQQVPNPAETSGAERGNPVSSPTREGEPQGELMEVRTWDVGKSEGRPVIGRIRVSTSPGTKVSPRPTGAFSRESMENTLNGKSKERWRWFDHPPVQPLLWRVQSLVPTMLVSRRLSRKGQPGSIKGSAFEVLEPYAGKLARTVLRGAGGP